MSACPRARDLAVVLDYWTGELPRADADAFEEHLFACDACLDDVQRVGRVAEGVREATRAGRVLGVVLTRSALERLEASGVTLRRYVAEPGQVVACQASPHRYSVVALRGDFRGVARVDLAMDGPTGAHERLEALPFDPEGGEILLVQSGDVIRAAPAGRLRLTLYARDDAGERVLATYTLQHASASERP